MLAVNRLLWTVSLVLLASGAQAQNAIKYSVEPNVPDKSFKITIDIPRVHEHLVRVQMPVWAPGAYFVGNFATNVSDVTAETVGDSKALRVYRSDANTWEIAVDNPATVSVHYTLKNADLEEAGGVLVRGHISGPRTYMYVVGRKAEPVELEIVAPTGVKEWKCITSLDPMAPNRFTFGSTRDLGSVHSYKAPTYDVLADAPVEMGNFAEVKFVAGGKPHSVVLYGQYDSIDKAKLTDYCKRIATVETAMFGGAPFERYVFEFRATSGPSRGAGGLEHLGSTEIGTISTVDDRVRSVIAHEYFHLWNVKRIRPFVLGPFNYVDPPHTANLWWSEGVTSYYGDLLSKRGGLNTREEYLKHLSDLSGQFQNNAARLKVSADESSLRVWEANNSSGYGGLSYYTKGELIGLCLDLKIRQETEGHKSLDDVMRALFEQVRHGSGPGFEEDDIEKTVNRISGKNLSDYYDLLVRSTEELPLQECLGYAGLTFSRIEPPKLVGDAGLTTQFTRGPGGITVSEVAPSGAADKAGLKPGDRITAVNGSSEGRGIGAALAATKPGEKVSLTISRGGANKDIELTMGSRTVYNWIVAIDSAASPAQVRLRDSWLAGK